MDQRTGHELAENETGEGLDRPRVYIATPCTDQVQAGYCRDLAMLYCYSLISGVHAAYGQNRGTIIPQQRATLVDEAMKFGATHVLFVDSDMRFPQDALLQLLAHDKPIVAANYPRRRHPVLPTAERATASGKSFVFTGPTSTGTEAVLYCGFGFILIRMDVFGKIPEPWFQIGYTSADAQYVGEDFFFCQRAKKAGIEILIDHDLSKVIKHTGAFDYTHEHCEQIRAKYAPKIELVTANGA